MMKAVMFLVLAVSASSFAIMPEGTYKGGGTWKMEGTKATGAWMETMAVKADGKDVGLFSHLQVMNNGAVVHEEKTSSRFVMTGEGFFNVMNGEKKVGSGYCFKANCHYGYVDAAKKNWGEETIHINGTTLHRMGSVNGETGGEKYKTAYFGQVDKQ